jgi:hypothetical protein
VLRTRAPLSPKTSFDLHVLGMPPAFVLSQDQTLKFDVRFKSGGMTRNKPLIFKEPFLHKSLLRNGYVIGHVIIA